MKTALHHPKVVRGEGVWLELEDGNRIMDMISSWWVNIHGHSHPRIAEAIYHQAQKLEHVIFAGFTHDPAEQVAARLLEELPEPMEKVFYTDNGSTAVEVGLKMAYQYWQNTGEPGRTSFIAFEGSYHGDTVGAMSAGSRSVFTRTFQDLLFDVSYAAYPVTWQGDQEVEVREQSSLQQVRELLEKQGGRYAGIIIEPLIQGAGGMRMCRPEFLKQLQALAREYGVFLIYDEVMTGFGRTGDWFAARRSGTEPDILCMSKGITGGALPLAATACTRPVYDAFYSEDPYKTLYHGHSYTANPLGCAAALASLELMQEAPARFRELGDRYQPFIEQLQRRSDVQRIRRRGTVLAMDLVTPEQEGYLNRISLWIREQAIEKQLLLRPLGNTLYFMPPYCISAEELGLAFERTLEIIEQAAGDSGNR